MLIGEKSERIGDHFSSAGMLHALAYFTWLRQFAGRSLNYVGRERQPFFLFRGPVWRSRLPSPLRAIGLRIATCSLPPPLAYPLRTSPMTKLSNTIEIPCYQARTVFRFDLEG